MKKSIRKKINYLIIFSLVTLSICMIGVNIVIVNKYTEHNSEIMLEKTCESQALKLNNQFRLVEQSVQSIYDISEEMRPSVDQLNEKALVDEFIGKFQDIAISISNDTDGALAVYYRMNPEITGSGTTGFFYVKSPETGRFEANEATDLFEYGVNNVEHVGWYYIPVWEGKPVWMEPYYNANIGIEMISYVVPIFEKNTLVGVIGMDVDFNAITKMTEDFNVYQSGGAVLCSTENAKVYYNKCKVLGDMIPSNIKKEFEAKADADRLCFIKINDVEYGIYYRTLVNKMKILVYAKKDEINTQRFSFLLTSGIIFMVIFALTLLISIRVSSRIVKPIGAITEATKRFAEGDWEAKVFCDTRDELQELTENVTIMADKTKEYIAYIQEIAKKDALTGLRNKTDYLMYVDQIVREYETKNKKYSVIVFDVNHLKYVNDNFGHEKGDELIVAASKYICKHFIHSPIFRVGGDEFVAILDSDDYENRYELVEEFKKYMKLSAKSEDIMDFCIACGLADYGKDGQKFDDIFAVADQRMYNNKKELKD